MVGAVKVRSMSSVLFDSSTTRVHALAAEAPLHSRTARVHLLLLWLIIVAVPWALQLRSYCQLAMRHEISQNLIPSKDATRVNTAADVLVNCPVFGSHLAGVFYSIYPTHYFESDGIVICHFITPQYNTHGMFSFSKEKTKPAASAPRSCANDSYTINNYYYHGSIGYYALYTEGVGTYCSLDNTMYMTTAAIGSVDMNMNTLARYVPTSGYRTSYLFSVIGSIWLAYRAIVLIRSFQSCANYGHRLIALKEPLSLFSAIVYVQQAARIAPHSARNWHRLLLLYLLAEGLMTDLFLVIAHDGMAAKIQYVSLGYNIAGVLSVLFEIVENSKLLPPVLRIMLKRLLFNTESSLWGELLFSIAMSRYLTGLNQSDLAHTHKVGEAISYYAWGLINHGIIVVGQATFILTVRAVGTVAYVLYRFGSLRMFMMPCCVDSIMGYRYKLATISGYAMHGSRLYYSRETLKAHGLLKGVTDDGHEYLLYHKIHWLATAHEDLTVVGVMAFGHAESSSEIPYIGPVSVCDRMLGGLEGEWELWDSVEEQESSPLVEPITVA